jgi:hypothetical protein
MRHRHHQKYLQHQKRHNAYVMCYNRTHTLCKVISQRQLQRSLQEENKFKLFFYALCLNIVSYQNKENIFDILNNIYQESNITFESMLNIVKKHCHSDLIYNKNIVSLHKFTSNKNLRKYVKSIIILLLSTRGKTILNTLSIDDDHIKVINKYTLKIFRKTTHFLNMLYFFLNK